MSSCFATASHHHYPAGNGHGLVLHPLVPVIAQPSLVVSNKFSNRGTSVKHTECSHNTTEASEKNLWSSSQVENNFEAIVPDGAIVAIQDANQHMYFTIDGEENSFRIGGAIHYSLAGERHLFRDYTLYTGDLGTTYLVFKAFQVIKHLDDLNLCLKIVKACDSASAKFSRVTFICRCAGVCAFGVVIAKHVGDERLVDYYLRQFKEIKLPHDFPCEDDAQVRPKNDKQKNTQDLKKKDENKPNVFCGGYYSVNLQPKANNPFVNNVEVDFGI
ncbi:hypothetical protein KIW84_062442 [Lathyrus oleraceus]|uniref:Uncharacterized protein n=1 Tax=Pisum sativum TaxID=3888 RepID=A0A9D4W6F8_PEA|nr:hypothetical protein KIW84_062442 [Pisum sativum]